MFCTIELGLHDMCSPITEYAMWHCTELLYIYSVYKSAYQTVLLVIGGSNTRHIGYMLYWIVHQSQPVTGVLVCRWQSVLWQ